VDTIRIIFRGVTVVGRRGRLGGVPWGASVFSYLSSGANHSTIALMEEPKPAPGQVVAPQAATPAPQPVQTTDPPVPERLTEQPTPVAPSPPPAATTTAIPAAAAVPPTPETALIEQPAAETASVNWQFTGEESQSAAYAAGSDDVPLPARPDPSEEITWTASEFIAHEKSPGWYALLALGGVVGAGVIYALTKDEITAGIVLLAAVLLGVFAARKPHVQQYTINQYGIHIGQRTYSFQGFKSFSVTEEGAIASVVFMPLKRFMPALTIYVAPDMENQVLDYLAGFLPLERHRQDAVDSLMKHIRF
jgi:hypothetical protein